MLAQWQPTQLGEICKLLWQVSYKIEGDEGSQFGLTSRIWRTSCPPTFGQ
jgi:hypothetical protein